MVLRLFVHKQTIRVPSLYFQGASEQEERSREKGSQKVSSCVPNPIELLGFRAYNSRLKTLQAGRLRMMHLLGLKDGWVEGGEDN